MVPDSLPTPSGTGKICSLFLPFVGKSHHINDLVVFGYAIPIALPLLIYMDFLPGNETTS
jgi:hypothetical protein